LWVIRMALIRMVGSLRLDSACKPSRWSVRNALATMIRLCPAWVDELGFAAIVSGG
jgi:hypothetical protein